MSENVRGKKKTIGATQLVRGDGCPRHLQAKERPTSNLVFLVLFTIPIGCPREVRCPRNVRGVFWLHVFMTFWMQHLTWRLRSFCIALVCSLGVSLYHGASFVFPLQMVRRNQIVRLNKDSAVKILCGIHAAGSLLVHEG